MTLDRHLAFFHFDDLLLSSSHNLTESKTNQYVNTQQIKMTNSSPKLVLALNAGSSSLKASVIRGEETVVAFLAERLSTRDASISVHHTGQPKLKLEREENEIYDHAKALSKIIACIEEQGMINDLVGVGHRVVHGGTIFSDSAIITNETLEQIKSVSHLAPL